MPYLHYYLGCMFAYADANECEFILVAKMLQGFYYVLAERFRSLKMLYRCGICLGLSHHVRVRTRACARHCASQ